MDLYMAAAKRLLIFQHLVSFDIYDWKHPCFCLLDWIYSEVA